MFAFLEFNRTSIRADIQQQNLERLAQSHNAGLAKALWEYDVESIDAILTDLAMNPDFHSASILELDGTPLVERLVDDGTHVARIFQDYPSIEETLSITVNGQDTNVGTLILTFHNANIEQELLSNLKDDAIVVMGLGLVIVIVTVIATREIVGKPLTIVRDSIDQNRRDGISAPIDWSARDEIGDLVLAFNELQREREKATRALRQHHDELETLVAERTKALAESEALLNSAFANMPDGFFMIGEDGRLVKFNQNFFNYLVRLGIPEPLIKQGTELRQIIEAMGDLGLYGDAISAEDYEHRLETYRSDEPAHRQIEGQAGDMFEVRKAPLGGGASVNIMVDLTELRRSQEKIRESEERLLFAMDSVGAQFWINDITAGTIEYNSTTFFDMLGVSENDIPRTFESYQALIHPDDHKHVDIALRAFLQNDSPLFETEYRIRDVNGGWHWILSRGHAIERHKNRHVTKIGGISLNIDDMKRKTALLSSVLGSMNQGLVAFDEDLRLIVRNDRFMEIRDYPSDLVTEGARFEDLMRYDAERYEFGDGDPAEITKKRVALAKRFRPHFFERKRPDGSIIEVSGGPLPSGGFVSTYTDVTERRAAEAKLADAYAVISSSIEYAARIQRSVLPTTSQLDSLLPKSYVIWEPRDVVGGDLYWVRAWGTGTLIALGDCTGHGVPGAFMTLIATSALEQAMKEVTPGRPSLLLQRMHQLVQATIGRFADGVEANDGLEIGLCYIDPSIEVIKFSGARFSLFHIPETAEAIEDIVEIKGDKTGIGYPDLDPFIPFAEETLLYGADDSFHLLTDGIIDQIGGERRRAFGKKRYRAALWDAHQGSITSFPDTLETAFETYRGDESRRDDLSAIGFKP